MHLNRVTPEPNYVIVTLTALVDVQGCRRPMTVKKDLLYAHPEKKGMVIY